MNSKAQIVATIGPATKNIRTIKKMIERNMDVARLNFSHGTHENHKMIIDRLRQVEKMLGMPITIMQDFQDPKTPVAAISPKAF